MERSGQCTLPERPREPWRSERIFKQSSRQLQERKEFVQYGQFTGRGRKEALADVHWLLERHGALGAWLWDPFLNAEDVLQTLFFNPHKDSDLRALSNGKTFETPDDDEEDNVSDGAPSTAVAQDVPAVDGSIAWKKEQSDMVLDADAPLFALQVESVIFKFISLSWLERSKDIYPEDNSLGVHEQLLLQVAKTPHWKGWLHATYEYPDAGSVESRVLAEALTKLAEPHWRDFIFALALSTSQGSAEAVADILTHVVNKLGSVKTQSIWSEAFERWNAWDYGRGEGDFYLSSPQVCAFDFPVAMYYAHMPAAERDALERDLQNAIVLVEQQWFTSELNLCSERNRLASRLRLVRHGSALAAGGEEALPPPVQPDSEYAEVRYRYYDINATLARVIGR